MLDTLNLRYHITQVQWSASIFVAHFKQNVETNKKKILLLSSRSCFLIHLTRSQSLHHFLIFQVFLGLIITNPAQVLAFLALTYLQNRCRVFADSNNHCCVNLTASGMIWEVELEKNTAVCCLWAFLYSVFLIFILYKMWENCEKRLQRLL